MFIICKNDFPYRACQSIVDRALAEKIAECYQDECGLQIGLAEKTFFHVVEVERVSLKLLDYLTLGESNGS